MLSIIFFAIVVFLLKFRYCEKAKKFEKNLPHFLKLHKGQITLKGPLVSSNSPKKRTNKFIFTTTTNSFVRFLGEFEDIKKSFRNYLTFSNVKTKWEIFSYLVWPSQNI